MPVDDIAGRLNLPQVGQMGYVVEDVDEAVVFCRKFFGITPWLLMEEKPDPCIERGRRVHPVLKIALAYSGPIQLELIEVLEGETFHLEQVKEGREGLHHLGYMVSDLGRRVEAARAAGIAVLQRGTIRESGFTVDYAYLDTRDEAGMVMELIRWRLGPLPIPVGRRIFNLVSRIGGLTVFRGRVIR